MTQIGSNNPDLSNLVDGWTKIVIKVLQTKIARLKIRNTGSLFNSLDFSISGQGFSFQIYFSYNLYGIFVDMGVGRNGARANGEKKERRKREWESKIFYAQVMTLGELARKQCGEQAAKNIVSSLNAVYDLKKH